MKPSPGKVNHRGVPGKLHGHGDFFKKVHAPAPELSLVVQAPAAGRSVGESGAGMGAADGYFRGRIVAGKRDQNGCVRINGISVSKLAISIISPAGHRPPERIEQVNMLPAATACTVSPDSVTGTGTLDKAVEPSPSWP